MRRIIALAVLLAVASCASPEPKAPAPPPPPNAPMAVNPPPLAVPSPQRPRDACGAYELRGLVGKLRSEIPIPVDPSRRRVACTTCPVTLEMREDRLNIFFDADTGVIKSVICG